jgi:hypothetical protein
MLAGAESGCSTLSTGAAKNACHLRNEDQGLRDNHVCAAAHAIIPLRSALGSCPDLVIGMK